MNILMGVGQGGGEIPSFLSSPVNFFHHLQDFYNVRNYRSSIKQYFVWACVNIVNRSKAMHNTVQIIVVPGYCSWLCAGSLTFRIPARVITKSKKPPAGRERCFISVARRTVPCSRLNLIIALEMCSSAVPPSPE
jgi:hypothetical protein